MSQPTNPDLLLRDAMDFCASWSTLRLNGGHKLPTTEVPSDDAKHQFLLRAALGIGALGAIAETDRSELDGAAITADAFPGLHEIRWGKFLGEIGVRYVLTDPRNIRPHSWQKKYGAYDSKNGLIVLTDETIYEETGIGPSGSYQRPEYPFVSDAELSALVALVDRYTAKP